MDEAEARAVLAIHMQSLEGLLYERLVDRLLDQREALEAVGASGVRYKLEFQGSWDSGPDSTLRVSGSIDDAGWGSFDPVTDDFLVSPDGSISGGRSGASPVGSEVVSDWRLPGTGFLGTVRFLGGVFGRSFVAGARGRPIDGWPPKRRVQPNESTDDETKEP